MHTLRIEKPAEGYEFSYEIIWETGFSRLAESILSAVPDFRKICIVADENVAALYLDDVKDALQSLDCEVLSCVIPAGEAHKNLETVKGLYDFLIRSRVERKDLLLALGGGVTGDLTGFTAATYLRGIPFIQIPTTLLADVDSSVGGKTGVDFDQFKNMVGAFYQPRLVFMNTSVLKTLPDEQFSSGMAEVIKSALIRDVHFFDWLESHVRELLERDPETLTAMIRRCCEIKASVVAEDPKETGLRAILNYGHTIGHAVEKLSDFRMLHGHCVALGMMAALSIDRNRGTISEEMFLRIQALLKAFALPCHITGLAEQEVLQAMRSDKKMEAGKIKFILLPEAGHAEIVRSLTDEQLLEAIRTIVKQEGDC